MEHTYSNKNNPGCGDDTQRKENMTKLMTRNINVKLDEETSQNLLFMAKNSDSSKIVRLAIQTLYNQWPIVSVPIKRLSEFDQCHAQERQQADE